MNPLNYCTREAAQRPPTEAELKEFCRLAGVHWHEWGWIAGAGFQCSCGLDLYGDKNYTYRRIPFPTNPTFRHPEEVLEVMKKFPAFHKKDYNGELFRHGEYVKISLITEPYALFWAAFEWMKKG